MPSRDDSKPKTGSRTRRPAKPKALPVLDPLLANAVALRGRQAVDYSRFVARAKLMLPLAAGAIIMVLGVWPSLSSGISRLVRHRNVVDPAMSRDFRMLNPRYTGLDKNQRPFTVTADSAREQGVNTSNGDALMALDAPKADILSKGRCVGGRHRQGRHLPATGTSARSLRRRDVIPRQRLRVSETATARVDMDTSSAAGQDPISGGGPSGTASGRGFRVLHKGDIVVFTGKSHLVLNSAHDSGQ